MLERFFYIELEEYLIGSVLFFFFIYIEIKKTMD